MIHTVIWLSILGVSLLIPNILAIRLAMAGAGSGTAAAQVSTGVATAVRAARPARRRVALSAPRFLRRGYLWKALSPLLFGLSFLLGLGVGGAVGYAIMGLGLLNMLLGFWGWDDYIPGKMGKR